MKQLITRHRPVPAPRARFHRNPHPAPPKTNLLRVLCAPTRLIVDKFQVILPHNRKVGHAVVGTVIMFTGGALELLVEEVVPHVFVLKVVAVTFAGVVHAFGAAPLIKTAADKFGIEV